MDKDSTLPTWAPAAQSKPVPLTAELLNEAWEMMMATADREPDVYVLTKSEYDRIERELLEDRHYG